jgi:hypothetical protein
MKKTILLLALAVLTAGGVFAQRVGDTIQAGGSNWTVQSVSGDTMTLKKAQGGYKVGDRGPGGGIIFHVDAAGFQVEGYSGATGRFTTYTAHYLEAAPQDSGKPVRWGTNISSLTSVITTIPSGGVSSGGPSNHPDASKVGNGRKDTMTIIASAGQTEGAAQLAASAAFGGLNDWFLPSIGELRLLWAQKNLPGLNMAREGYWSATPLSNSGNVLTSSFNQTDRFVAGIAGGNANNINVRAIRAF